MNLNRLVGSTVFISILLILILYFYPSDVSNQNVISKVIEPEDADTMIDKPDENVDKFKTFSESDFDFFVYRAHVLSSEKNSELIVKKIKNGGFPAFIEALEDNNELFVVYVGPFLSEDDIVNNMEAIQRLSESQNGEISRWKL
ncbi:MAG: SPOR domain-containing protein [Gammaproteobacteria bacterium]|tara:strand:+ start:3744 stop:4175 length:432 start_codon:yes stop_codon:yes gene_type:complete